MSSRNNWGAVRKLPSKRFQASYIGPDGERHTASDTFVTKTEATFWLAQIRVSINEGTWQLPSREFQIGTTPVFEDYALRHIELQTNRRGELLRESTKSVYRRILKTNLRSFLKKDLDQITKSQVQEWYANLVKTGKKLQPPKPTSSFLRY